jgi:hypothetical protein
MEDNRFFEPGDWDRFNYDVDDPMEKDSDEYDPCDWEPDQKELDHAASVVGKYCTCPDGCTDHLKGMLCKVISVNNEERGGNAAQVKVIVFKNNAMWDFRNWMWCPEGERYEVFGGGWMEPTDARPTMVDRIVGWTAAMTRIAVSEIGREKTAFGYKWWKDADARFHAPLCSLVGAFCDTARAFKRGVYIGYDPIC